MQCVVFIIVVLCGMRQGKGLTGCKLLRLDVFGKVWLHKGKPLLDATFDISAALSYIALDCRMSVSHMYQISSQMSAFLRRRDRHKSGSASAKIFKSSISKTRSSWSAKIPSRMSTCGE